MDNLQNYIILEGRVHKGDSGSYTYPDLYVAKHRLSALDPQVKGAAKTFGCKVKDTGYELDEHRYIGNIKQPQAIALNLACDNITLNMRQFEDFLLLLNSREPLFGGNGKIISRMERKNILDEISGHRNPRRGEWLDAAFEEVNGVFHIRYDHRRYPDGSIQPQRAEPLESCVCVSAAINLKRCNRQGLPARIGDDCHYSSPLKEGSVARFSANSDGAFLSCYRDQHFSNAGIGVRAAKIKEN